MTALPSKNQTSTISGLRGVISNLEHHRGNAAAHAHNLRSLLTEIKENGENDDRGETLYRALRILKQVEVSLEALR